MEYRVKSQSIKLLKAARNLIIFLFVFMIISEIVLGIIENLKFNEIIFVIESEDKSITIIPRQYENYKELVSKIINIVENNRGIIIDPRFTSLIN